MAGDAASPLFRLKLGGRELDLEGPARVVQIEVDAALHLPDALRVRIGPAFHSALAQQGVPLGDTIEIGLSYGQDPTVLASGTVASWQMEVGPVISHLSIIGYGSRYFHQRQGEGQLSNQSQLGDHLKALGSSGHQVAVTGASLSVSSLMQSDWSHEKTLREWSARAGLIMLDARTEVQVKDLELNYTGPTLKMKESLHEVRIEANVFDQVTEVKVISPHSSQREAIVATAGKNEARSLMKGRLSGSDAALKFGAVPFQVSDLPVRSQEEADQLARAIYNDRLLQFVRAEGIAAGDPEIRVGKVIALENVGKRFSGTYLVTRATHRYEPDRGYRTHFEAHRPSLVV